MPRMIKRRVKIKMMMTRVMTMSRRGRRRKRWPQWRCLRWWWRWRWRWGGWWRWGGGVGRDCQSDGHFQVELWLSVSFLLCFLDKTCHTINLFWGFIHITLCLQYYRNPSEVKFFWPSDCLEEGLKVERGICACIYMSLQHSWLLLE